MEKQSQSKTRMKLKQKLMMVILPLVIVSLLCECVVFFLIAKQAIQKRTTEYMHQYLRQLTTSVDNELDTSIRMNAQIAVSEQVVNILRNYEQSDDLQKIEYREKMSDTFISLISAYDNIKDIYVFDNKGNEFYARKRYGQNIAEMIKMEWYQETLEKEGEYVIFLDSKSGADTRNPNVSIGIARSIVDIYSKKSYGIVLVEIPYSILEDSIFGDDHQLNLGHESIYIRDADGSLIYTTNTTTDYEMSIETITKDSNICIDNKNGEDIIRIDCASKNSNWKYTYLCKMKYLMTDMEKIKQILCLFVVIMAVLAGGIVAVFSEIFLKPVKKMIIGMKKVTGGNYDVQIQANTQDEFRYLITTFNSMTRSIRELIEKVYHVELVQKEAKLEALQQQINPHFLYNTLESMRGLALEENCVRVADMAKNISGYMRYNMRMEDSRTTLKEEQNHVLSYIRIINYRFNDKISLEIDFPVEMLKLSMPKFILQPIVENSVLHGFSEKKADCRIKISGYVVDKDAIIEISDNGKGISNTTLLQMNEKLQMDVDVGKKQHQDQSVGIYNVNSRLKLNYGNQYGVSFSSKVEDGTTVTIRFPV